MPLILAAVINAVLALGVLVVIVGMHVREIRASDAVPARLPNESRFSVGRSDAVEIEEEPLPAGNVLIG